MPNRLWTAALSFPSVIIFQSKYSNIHLEEEDRLTSKFLSHSISPTRENKGTLRAHTYRRVSSSTARREKSYLSLNISITAWYLVWGLFNKLTSFFVDYLWNEPLKTDLNQVLLSSKYQSRTNPFFCVIVFKAELGCPPYRYSARERTCHCCF